MIATSPPIAKPAIMPIGIEELELEEPWETLHIPEFKEN